MRSIRSSPIVADALALPLADRMAAWLFDTDALSELLRPRPDRVFLNWLAGIPRERQFTSAVTVGELFEGAHRAAHRDVLLQRIEETLLPAVTVLPYDLAVARIFGRIQAELRATGESPGDADVMIAATAVHHGLRVVTRNGRHFRRIEGLDVEGILERRPDP